MQAIDLFLYKDNKLYKKNNNIKVKYNEERNAINYIDDVLTTITINKDSLIFKRSNKEYEFILSINKYDNTCTYKLKKEQVTFDIEVFEATFINNKKQLEIIYKIETDEALNRIVIVKH